jgi:hypothetical protein
VFKTKQGDTNEGLLLPDKIETIFIDRPLVAVDNINQTATVSLMTMHPIPTFSGEFGTPNYAYELVGELKVPFTAMDALCVYYLSTRVKDREGFFQSIKKFMAEPSTDDLDKMRYGPTSMRKRV